MKLKMVFSLSLVAVLLLPGCGDQELPPEDPALAYTEFAANVEREANPDIDVADADQFVADANQFALAAYRETLDESADGQLFSPLSLRTALAMIYVGAEHDTKAEMAHALSFNLPDETLHAGFNWILAALDDRNLAADSEYQAQELSIVNAIWPKLDAEPAESFLEVLAKNYGKGVYALDYESDPDAARKAINDKVEEWTKGIIDELLPEDSVLADTLMVLTSTLYMYAPWNVPFVSDFTQPKSFQNLNGNLVEVDTMRGPVLLEYGVYEETEVFALPFRENEMDMVFLVPPEDEFMTYASQLNAQVLATALQDLNRTSAMLELPKFKLEHTMSATETLKAMGLEQAFTRDAQFEGVGLGPLYISSLEHQAYIAVDENGTEAAAATAVVAFPASSQPELKIDRPFVFIIRDRPTGVFLFVGHVANL